MRKTLLFYTHHSVGIGHLMRSLALARSFASEFRVVMVCGGKLPAFARRLEDIELIPMPPVVLTPEGQWRSEQAEITVDDALRMRRTVLLDALERRNPAVVLVEFYPFGRMQYSTEILSLLEAAHRSPARPLVFTSVRDMLERRRALQQIYDDLASVLCNHLCDGVLVHSDPTLVPFEKTFRPEVPLRTPIYYTGYVTPYVEPQSIATADPEGAFPKDPGILVSAGGGQVGAPLLRAALEARRASPVLSRIPMTLAAGKFMSEDEWRALGQECAGADGITLVRWIPNLRAALGRARASVSQCGYNTFLDLASAGTPALVIPYESPADEEQVQRARMLAAMGMVRMAELRVMDANTLAGEIGATLKFVPHSRTIDINGAERSLSIVSARLTGREPHAVAAAAYVPA
jgi:predicted glycosyltransferase